MAVEQNIFIEKPEVFFKMKLDTKGRNCKESSFRVKEIILESIKVFGLNSLQIGIEYESSIKEKFRLNFLITAEDKFNSHKRYIQIFCGEERVEIRLGNLQIKKIVNAIQDFLSKKTNA